jgi:hypothetical protein
MKITPKVEVLILHPILKRQLVKKKHSLSGKIFFGESGFVEENGMIGMFYSSPFSY